MNKNLVFSIIIPAYNAEKTIEKCIDSVEKQSVSNVEIVIVNDGSTDSTCKVVEKCQKKYSNIRLISKIRGGVATARNFGIDNAKGRFLIFLDADDELCDNSLSTLYRYYLEKKSFDVLICDSYSYTDIDNDIEYTDKIFHNINYNDLSFPETKRICQNLSSMCIGVFSKEFLMKNALYVKEGISVGEDTDFLFRCILKCEKIFIVECNLFLYKYNENSVMRNLNKKNIMDILTVCNERIKDILENKPVDIDEKKALDFFAGKFIHFGIKLNRLPRKEKKELIQFMKKNRYIICYAKSAPDRIFCLFIYLFGVRISCFLFDSLVKIRNLMRGT